MALFFGLNIADSLVTWKVLSMGGVELNWYKVLLDVMPVWGVMAIKLALAGLFAFLVYRYRRSLFKPLNIGLGLIVAFNLFWLLTGVL